jgi:hypothetical protein
MKHMKRLLSVLVVVFLLAAPLSALAQETPDPLCGGLSAEDCDLLLSAQGNLATATSFAIPAMELKFNLNDGESNTAFSVKGSGEIMLPTSGSMLLHLVITELMVEPADPTVPSALEVLIDGEMGYVNVDGEWYGEELAESDLADLQNTLDQVSGLTSVGDVGALGIDMTGVMTTTRGDDVDMMGMKMAHFTTTLDVGNLLVAVLSSPMLGQLLGASGEDLGLGELSPDDMAMMGMIFQPMLAGTTLSVEDWFGVEDKYLHKLVIDANLSLDLSMLGGEGAGPITGALYLDIELDQINATFEVAAPESYKPMEELDLDMEGLGGLGMGM